MLCMLVFRLNFILITRNNKTGKVSLISVCVCVRAWMYARALLRVCLTVRVRVLGRAGVDVCVRSSNLINPACKARAPYCHLWPLWLHYIF
jgi:hypothetical protein